MTRTVRSKILGGFRLRHSAPSPRRGIYILLHFSSAVNGNLLLAE